MNTEGALCVRLRLALALVRDVAEEVYQRSKRVASRYGWDSPQYEALASEWARLDQIAHDIERGVPADERWEHATRRPHDNTAGISHSGQG